MERLQKAIADSGYTSRRKAEELIKKGLVEVNNTIVTEMGFKVRNNDDIVVEGNALRSKEDKEYYLLYKPNGVISSAHDEHNRKTVLDLVPSKSRIYPIGRLDYDTTGIILLTNDGELTNILSHPKYEVEKTYIAKVEGILTGEEFSKLKKGIMVEDRKTTPTRIKLKNKNKMKNFSNIEISLIEGRNHIVKNLFEALGHNVISLKRETYAFLTLEGLKKGEYRALTVKEVKKLYSLK